MIPEQKKVMLRYTTLVLFFALMSVCIIVKAGLIMFAERQYWKDVADRFVKEKCGHPAYPGKHHLCRWQTDGQQPARI